MDVTVKILRYNPDGSPDTSFDGDGKVRTSFVGGAAASHVAIQPDGRIVVRQLLTAMRHQARSREIATLEPRRKR